MIEEEYLKKDFSEWTSGCIFAKKNNKTALFQTMTRLTNESKNGQT